MNPAAMTTTSRISEPARPAVAFPRLDPVFTARLSAEAYRTLAALVHQHSHIHLGQDRQPMLANRLRKRLRALGLTCFDEYCALLRSPEGPKEVEHLVDMITTNHTKFFREPEHFTFLTNHALPELAPRLQAAGTPLRVWSAAASSGEESYTLAVVLAEFFRTCPGANWIVEATDISHRMLAQARSGIYPLERVSPVVPELLKRYFQKGVGTRAGLCRVKPELRERVGFERVNLFQAEYPLPHDQHVIFCRNVMIYFDVASRATLVQRLTRHLAPGGYLVIGHAESLMGIRHNLAPVRQSIYRKP
jgi:chemotaxis protein methyltransferase CheR